ncbi:MAG: DUF1588 domain-containing protein, partial [Planctomycetota bacterium]
LQEDKDVLKQLLTTDRVVAAPKDRVYFGRRRTDEEQAKAVAEAKRLAAKATQVQQEALETAKKQLADLESFVAAHPDEARSKQKELNAKKRSVTTAQRSLDAAKKRAKTRSNQAIEEADLSGEKIYARVSRRSFGNGSMKPDRVLATAPAGQRLGILTHPSWLVSHSDAMDNHAIHRGRWVRERLLGGGIPDVPITVDAMLPDEPHHTLRERMHVTRETYCATCHDKMDPLGLPFEMFNHAGVYREFELDKPVDTTGEIIDSGDPELDGKVSDAIDMIRRIAESERAEQVFVRHAFRFWMGRNETLNDAPVLQDAYHAYRNSGGSMKAMLVSLLTSDAFLFRTRDH